MNHVRSGHWSLLVFWGLLFGVYCQTGAAIEIVSPCGGETWAAGSYTLVWKADFKKPLQVEYSADDGET